MDDAEKQFIKSFLRGLISTLPDEYREKFLDNIVRYAEVALDKNIKKYWNILFITIISIMLVGIGFFLISWELASMIDIGLGKKGAGYLIIGIIVALIGMILIVKIKNKEM